MVRTVCYIQILQQMWTVLVQSLMTSKQKLEPSLALSPCFKTFFMIWFCNSCDYEVKEGIIREENISCIWILCEYTDVLSYNQLPLKWAPNEAMMKKMLSLLFAVLWPFFLTIFVWNQDLNLSLYNFCLNVIFVSKILWIKMWKNKLLKPLTLIQHYLASL